MRPGNNLPQSLLSNVATHVRIMSSPEYFEHVAKPNGENTLIIRPSLNASNNNSNNSNNGDNNSNNNQQPDEPRQFTGFTRIHKNYTTSLDNQLFYEEVLRKIVPSALAGQSFTVLFCGAPASGRSQTMYTIDTRSRGGDITHGMLYHTAKDLLAKPNVRVLMHAYHVRGDKVFDSTNDRPCQIRQLHSPLGPTPDVTSILLEKPEDAMIVPQDKRAYGSCFVCFEIYHDMQSVAGGGGGGAGGGAAASSNNNNNNNNNGNSIESRGAFSIITFVDMASFDDPLPPDVVTLRGCLERHKDGADPRFATSRCRLAELLEASVCRGRSLIGIATVIGQPAQLFSRTCAALEFVERLGAIEQVATVCQFVQPRWVSELPASIELADKHHEERVERCYQRGVSEVYYCMQKAFTAKLHAVEQQMSSNSEASTRLAELRDTLRSRLEQALQQLHAAADDEKQRVERNLDRAAELKKENDAAERAVEQEAGVLRVRAHDLYLQRAEIEQQQAAVSHELAIHDETRRRHNRTLEELQRATEQNLATLRDAKKNCIRSGDKVRLHWSQYNYESALSKIQAAKERAAAQLQEATARAVVQDQSQRLERQQRRTGAATGAQGGGGGGGGGGARSTGGANTMMRNTNNINVTSSSSSLSQQQLQQQRASGSRRTRSEHEQSNASSSSRITTPLRNNNSSNSNRSQQEHDGGNITAPPAPAFSHQHHSSNQENSAPSSQQFQQNQQHQNCANQHDNNNDDDDDDDDDDNNNAVNPALSPAVASS